MTYTFCCPAPGTIQRLKIEGRYTDGTPGMNYKEVPWRVTLENLTTGTLDYDIQVMGGVQNSSGVVATYINTPFFVYAGCNYRLTAQPTEIYANVRATMAPISSEVVFRGGSGSSQGGSVSYTLRDNEASRGGLVVVHCQYGGSTANVSLKWNGKNIPIRHVRIIPYKGIERMQEIVFRCGDPLPAVNTVTLTLSCGSHGEFIFHDWGAVLF